MAFATVTITYSGSTITVNPTTADVMVGGGELPESVKWVVQNSSGQVAIAAIRWKKDAAFTSFGVGMGASKEIYGLAPADVASMQEFEYGIDLLGPTGTVIDHIDPKIRVFPKE